MDGSESADQSPCGVPLWDRPNGKCSTFGNEGKCLGINPQEVQSWSGGGATEPIDGVSLLHGCEQRWTAKETGTATLERSIRVHQFEDGFIFRVGNGVQRRPFVDWPPQK